MSETNSSGEHGNSASHDEHHGVGHVVPLPLLIGVLLALLFLTVVTVATAQIDLGFLNIWVAMGIASVKATLVCVYFMHLRWDKPFNAVVLISAIAAVALFLGLAMMDTREYKHETYTMTPDQFFTEASKAGNTGEQYLDKVAPADKHRGHGDSAGH